jgi:hypothetical protein
LGVLFIDDKAKKEIERVINYAKSNIIEFSSIAKFCPGDFPDFVCNLFKDFRIVYSIEIQKEGKCHHLSVSLLNKKVPSVEAVQEIMEEFGMVPDVLDCVYVWLEKNIELPTGEVVDAINVLQLYDPLD